MEVGGFRRLQDNGRGRPALIFQETARGHLNMVRITWIILLAWASAAQAHPISPSEARAYAEAWLERNPVVLQYRQHGGADLEVRGVERFQIPDADLPFYLLDLAPRGYVLMNGDCRLKPVVCFGLAAAPDLEERPDNALYRLLLSHARTGAEWIAAVGAGAPACEDWALVDGERAGVSISAAVGEVVGPLLATSWGQSNHYNEYCPPDAGATNGYDGRVPVGCVATAFAQVMKYHAWPYRGIGSAVNEDTQGQVTGTYAADFADVYEWWHMQNDYHAFGAEPDEAVHAVAELMYELGVAAGMDYERDESTSGPIVLGSRMREHFLYEPPTYSEDDGSFVDALVTDLDQRRPCMASVPGHSVVIDGYMRHLNDVFFHVNYGWSGQNDDWYLLDQIQGRALVESLTGIRPALVAVPLETLPVPEGLELRWVQPETRSAEVTRLEVLERRPVSGTFVDRAENFGAFEVTSANDGQGWSLSSGGYAGTCFRKLAGARNGVRYHLTSTGLFRPNAGTRLSFRTKFTLLNDVFAVRIISDNGHTQTVLWSVSDAVRKNWAEMVISLGEFAGQDVRVQFEYLYDAGQFYLEGGVWLDEIRVGPTQWYEWDLVHTADALQVYRAETSTVFQDDGEDFGTFAITSTSAEQDWVLSAEGHSGFCFHKPAGGYTNVEYHLTSTRSFDVGAQTQLLFDARYILYEDEFSVQVSTDDGQTFAPVWSASDAVRERWTEVAIALASFAGRDVRIRFDYSIDPGKFYYQGGGVWVDDIRLVNVAGAEYADYPVHHTTLTDLSEGTHVLACRLWSDDRAHPRSEPVAVHWPPAGD
jgi:hypothetical protein